MRQYQHRFGNGGQSHGRRMTDEQLDEGIVEKKLRRRGAAAIAGAVGATAGGTAGYNRGFKRGVRTERKRQQAPADMKALYGGTDEEVGKSRFFDPEHRRQRRLGAAEAALGAGGVAGLALGGRGVVRTSRAAGKVTGITGISAKDAKAGETVKDVLRRNGKKVHVPVLAHGRHVGMLAGGAAAGAGAVGVNRFAESRRGRGWN